jgi:hypothetical protein
MLWLGAWIAEGASDGYLMMGDRDHARRMLEAAAALQARHDGWAQTRERVTDARRPGG